jgi:hypothetical protein
MYFRNEARHMPTVTGEVLNPRKVSQPPSENSHTAIGNAGSAATGLNAAR